MLVNDFDDERTLEEEENLSNEGESVGNELDALEKVRSRLLAILYIKKVVCTYQLQKIHASCKTISLIMFYV